MVQPKRIASLACAAALAATLAACGTAGNPYGANNYPVGQVPANSYPSGAVPSGYVEYGRISSIEVIQTANNTAPGNNGTAGTVIGGLVGGVLGNQIGHGGGRAAATVLGAVGGAVVGNRIARNNDGSYNSPTGTVYRVSVQIDNGQWRAYDVSATGDLRAGDRVRIENGVLYRA